MTQRHEGERPWCMVLDEDGREILKDEDWERSPVACPVSPRGWARVEMTLKRLVFSFYGSVLTIFLAGVAVGAWMF